MLKEVIKRDGKKTKFLGSKIKIAINKANKEVAFAEQATDDEIDSIVSDIRSVKLSCIHIEVVQDMVESALMRLKHFELAKKYIIYRYNHSINRNLSEAETSIVGLLNGSNISVIDENANKNSYLNSTQRDLMAGEVSRQLAKKMLFPNDIRKADEDMEIHWHDIDYSVQNMINCFSKDTNFMTKAGVVSFRDFVDGDTLYVPTHTGAVQKAVVHCYGVDQLYNTEFTRSDGEKKVFECTINHRWLLQDGTVTTSLKIGDTLLADPNSESDMLWVCTGREKSIKKEVWCLEVEHDHSFILEGGVVTGNCCLVNVKDILDNGTAMKDLMIETPKSFRIACNVLIQCVANIASNQYGGQSVAIKHLGKYLAISSERFRLENSRRWDEAGISYTEEQLDRVVSEQLKYELEQGVQSLQYQTLALITTCGQAPFLTLFMQLDEEDPYLEYTAMIIEEILKQRLKGIKNTDGRYITPAFPKLIYCLDENNCLEGGKYDYLTHLAAKCTIKRSYPDYISAKVMREQFDGEVFSCMGCVDGDEVLPYRFNNKVYVESFHRMWGRLQDYYEVKYQPGSECNKYMDTPESLEVWDCNLGFVKNLRLIRNVQRKWCKVKFSNGREITCTTDHPFETESRGLIRAGNLTTDDTVMMGTWKSLEGLHFNCEKAWFLGVVSGCGRTTSLYTTEFKLRKSVNHGRFCGIARSLYNVSSISILDLSEYNIVKITSMDILDDLNRFFSGDPVSIPSEVYSWDRSARLSYLKGVVDAGHTYKNTKGTTSLEFKRKEKALQVMYLMRSLSIGVDFSYSGDDTFTLDYNVLQYPGVGIKDAKVLCKVQSIEKFERQMYSYDVTTESAHFEVSGIYSHNCRSFLSPWKKTDWYVKMMGQPESEIGKFMWEGRFNQGRKLCPPSA